MLLICETVEVSQVTATRRIDTVKSTLELFSLWGLEPMLSTRRRTAKDIKSTCGGRVKSTTPLAVLLQLRRIFYTGSRLPRAISEFDCNANASIYKAQRRARYRGSAFGRAAPFGTGLWRAAT